MTYEEALTRVKGMLKKRSLDFYAIYKISFWSTIQEALEKQIPKKPNAICTSESLDLYDYYCPSCRLFLGSNISSEYGELFKHHCECGQAIDWSKE